MDERTKEKRMKNKEIQGTTDAILNEELKTIMQYDIDRDFQEVENFLGNHYQSFSD